jgi:hypothetical protein
MVTATGMRTDFAAFTAKKLTFQTGTASCSVSARSCQLADRHLPKLSVMQIDILYAAEAVPD